MDELKLLVRGSIPFALMFSMVCYIWWEHNKFFRRYGLQDAWTAFVNSLLLFVVLFYVYPLKFLTMNVFQQGAPNSGFDRNPKFVMLMYSAGVALVFGTMALLYAHAWRQRQTLELDRAGLVTLTFGLRAQLISAGIAIVSIVLTLVLSPRNVWLAGVWFGVMGPLHAWNGYRAGAALSKLKTTTVT